MIRRRRACTGAFAALATPLATPTLRMAANAAGLHYGTCTDTDLPATPSYADLVTAQCDIFAPNLNWRLLAPQPGETLARIDPNIGFVREHGLVLTGYHLVWHEGTPDWWAALSDRPTAERTLRQHVDAVATRFGADTWSWNVVNEAIRPQDGRPDGLRRTAFLDRFGTGYFKLAFDTAKAAAPNVLRVYNEYDVEMADPGQTARRTALLRLLDLFARESVPVQAIGLQCHLDDRTFAQFDPAAFRTLLHDIAARGLRILITELDMLDHSTAPVPARDAAIADAYRRLLSVALDEPAVASLVTWGLSDRYTWLNSRHEPRFVRPDGSPARPLPFDAELRPKPAFAALLDAFRAAPRRPLV